MIETDAQYFDGQTARAHEVSIWFSGQTLEFSTGTHRLTFAIDDLELVPPVGTGAWVLNLPDGASLRFNNAEFAARLGRDTGYDAVLRALEASWQWAAVALVVAIFGSWAVLTYGVPAGAKYVAFTMPPNIEASIREDGLGILDNFLFQPSELPPERQAEVSELFAGIIGSDSDYALYRLEFRASLIGANAFAVPGGLVVITDGMVQLAQSDAELLSVLAHEVGHQANRHSLRILLQDSASALFIAGLTGDFTSVSALGAAVPTMLMRAEYSRDFEREADDFAFDYLEAQGIDTTVLSTLLLRLEAEAGVAEDQGVTDWLSSHPRSGERIRQ